MNNINTRRRSSFSHRNYYYYFVLFFSCWCCSCCFEAISSSKFDIVNGDSDDDDDVGSSRTSASSRRHRSLYDPDDKKDFRTEEKNNAVSLEHRRADIYERIFEHEEKQQHLNRESMMKRAKNTNNTEEEEEEKKEKEDDDLIGIEDVRREEEEKEPRGGGGAFETKTLMTERMLVELETGYAEAMREFRERANAASLEKLNRLGEAYRNATREYFEAFEENARKVNNATMTTTDAKEVFSRRLDEYENMWIDKLGMNEFPEEPLASNAYFPEFLPTADAETLCKKFISSAKEASPHRAKRNVIQFPDVDFFNRHTWPTLGKSLSKGAPSLPSQK